MAAEAYAVLRLVFYKLVKGAPSVEATTCAMGQA
jgi:hypothetical protein